MTTMNLRDFMTRGYLQEVNRQFLHPLGLVLMVTEVTEDADGTVSFGGILDFRADPEGMIFNDGVISAEKANFVNSEELRRLPARKAALGFWVQPVSDDADPTS